ncbi:MAG: T9SS type A sorting domain-containing protein, partial [bacterium]
VNPLFVNPTSDFHLQPGSPCIDAGDPASPPDPDGTIADMGAYYFDQAGWQPGNLTVDLEPFSPPVVIPPQGGSFQYVVNINCDSTNYAIFDFWTELLLPDGQVMGPIINRNGVFIAPDASIYRLFTFEVPMWAMSGTYELHGIAGEYPDSIYSSDFFTFEKEPFSGGWAGSGEAYATISGWDGTERILLPSAVLEMPGKLELTNSPQPFNPETVFRFTLPSSGPVELAIYDLRGCLVSKLLDRALEAGYHSALWNASNLPSGVYLARLSTATGSITQRCLLLK